MKRALAAWSCVWEVVAHVAKTPTLPVELATTQGRQRMFQGRGCVRAKGSVLMMIARSDAHIQFRYRSTTSPVSLPKDARLQKLKDAFNKRDLNQWESFTSKFDDWEESLRNKSEQSIETFLRDEGFTGSVGARMSAALVEYFRDTEAAALIETIQKTAGAHPATKNDWLFSHPKFDGKLPVVVNLAALRNVFQKAESHIRSGFEEERSPLVIGVQAAMGTGKSFVVDIAHELLFVGENPVVLKVVYNAGQHLEMESTAAGDARRGFLTRLMIALYFSASPKDNGYVNDRISGPGTLTEAEVATHIRDKYAERPIIIAVDEIGKLYDEEIIRSLLSVVANVVRAVNSASGAGKELKAIGLVTALPHVGIKSLSERPVRMVRPLALSDNESKEFLRRNMKKGAKGPQQHTDRDRTIRELNLCCGGHPRSLATAVEVFNRAGDNWGVQPVQEISDIAFKCMWKVESIGVKTRDITEAMGDLYQHKFESRAVTLMEESAMLTEREVQLSDGTTEKVATIPPTVFFAPFDEVNRDERITFLRGMLIRDKDIDPAKRLEWVNYNWDYFRCGRQMPVIPPRFPLHVANGHKKSWEVSDLKFMFDSGSKAIIGNILKGDGVAALDKIEKTRYYYPELQQHPCIESMCVAKSENGVEVLCLFQSKINRDLKGALVGLNKAAKELKKKVLVEKELVAKWEGEILFIVFALDFKFGAPETNKGKIQSKIPKGTKECHGNESDQSSRNSSPNPKVPLKESPQSGKNKGESLLETADHPVMFINEERLPAYFTHTLAPAARICLERHKNSVKKHTAGADEESKSASTKNRNT